MQKHYPSRAEWLADRANGIGASEIAGVLGASHYATPLQTFRRKLEPVQDSYAHDRMRWGHAMEPVAEAIYRAKLAEQAITDDALEVYGDLRVDIHDEYDFLRATPDAVQTVLGQRGVVDFKIVSPFAKEWNRAEAPPEYQLQIQQQMLCAGVDRGVLVGLKFAHRLELDPNDDDRWNEVRLSIQTMLNHCPDPMTAASILGVQEVLIRPFSADRKLQAAIVKGGEEFWQRVLLARHALEGGASLPEVLHRYAPPARAQDTQTLAEVFRAEELAGAVEVPQALADTLLVNDQRAKDSAAVRDDAKAKIQQLLGNATTATVDGRVVARWSGDKRRVFRTVHES